MRISIGISRKDPTADLLFILKQLEPPATAEFGRARINRISF